jgi:hypothetical protein
MGEKIGRAIGSFFDPDQSQGRPSGLAVGRFAMGPFRSEARRVASPVTATTDFLAADVLNRGGRAYPAFAAGPKAPDGRSGGSIGAGARAGGRTQSATPPRDAGS